MTAACTAQPVGMAALDPDALGNRVPSTVNAPGQVPPPVAAEGVGTPGSEA